MRNIVTLPMQKPSAAWRRVLAPVAVTALLVLWTIAVSPSSTYGDNWVIWPAILALPVAICWHFAIIAAASGQRRFASLVALGHFVVLVPVWFVCLMLISKDSL